MELETTKIVFACNSNSCRSQMAEGWARQYLLENNLMNHPVLVTSVALDADAVRTKVLQEQTHPNIQRKSESCCGDSCDTLTQRKSVKAKAVAAMRELGVEMSGAIPKTWAELLPFVLSAKSQQNADELMKEYFAARSPCTENVFEEEKCGDLVADVNIDRLIVLCSCGDEMKFSLGKISSFVEEWNVDAPTAMSKAGEGDKAYTRVSLEIKEKVDRMMDTLAMVPNPQSL